MAITQKDTTLGLSMPVQTTTTITLRHADGSHSRGRGPGLPSFPGHVPPTLLLESEERWLREAPMGWAEALAKVVLVCGIYAADDPLVIHWRTGYSMAFVMQTVDVLQRSQKWLAADGVSTVARNYSQRS